MTNFNCVYGLNLAYWLHEFHTYSNTKNIIWKHWCHPDWPQRSEEYFPQLSLDLALRTPHFPDEQWNTNLCESVTRYNFGFVFVYYSRREAPPLRTSPRAPHGDTHGYFQATSCRESLLCLILCGRFCHVCFKNVNYWLLSTKCLLDG